MPTRYTKVYPRSMTRFYCPQVHHSRLGWVDLHMGASLKKLEADSFAEGVAQKYCRITRVARKPHGWIPPPPDLPESVPAPSEEDPIPEPAPPEQLPRVALGRKHEKARARAEAQYLRIPTALERLLGKDWV